MMRLWSGSRPRKSTRSAFARSTASCTRPSVAAFTIPGTHSSAVAASADHAGQRRAGGTREGRAVQSAPATSPANNAAPNAKGNKKYSNVAAHGAKPASQPPIHAPAYKIARRHSERAARNPMIAATTSGARNTKSLTSQAAMRKSAGPVVATSNVYARVYEPSASARAAYRQRNEK